MKKLLEQEYFKLPIHASNAIVDKTKIKNKKEYIYIQQNNTSKYKPYMFYKQIYNIYITSK